MLSPAKFLKEHKLISILIFIFLAAGLCVGAWYGYGAYQYRKTSDYALEKLKQAANPPDAHALANMIDFRSVGRDMAIAIKAAFPFYMAGQDQERKISEIIQKAILNQLSGKTESSQFKEDESEEKVLRKPLVLLPNNFAEQFVSNLAKRETTADSALVSTIITNPQLKKPVNLLLRMKKTDAGWVVSNIVNAREIASQIRDELLERHNRLREVYEEKNAATRKKMEQVLPVLSCSTDAGVLSDGKTMILIVHVLARNKGPFQTNNYSVDVSIFGNNNELVERRFLNVAKPVMPGEDFDHRWSYELESKSPLAQELLSHVPLHCSAAWKTLGLSNAQVWHIEEVPNPDKACVLDGHNHPEGFCFTPIFLP